MPEGYRGIVSGPQWAECNSAFHLPRREAPDSARQALEYIRAITMGNWEHSGEMANAMDRIYDLADEALGRS